MLKELQVENLALIQQAIIPWQEGFNALTGETGAGKSMVIRALGLLLGGRAQQEYIRTGCESCLVQGVFLPPWPEKVAQDLAAAGFEKTDELICTREIQRPTKSVCRINLRSVPLAFYKSIVSQLVNIHGQMEHMNILEPWYQLELLDKFGGSALTEAAAAAASAYQAWSKAKNAMAAFEAAQAETAAKSEFLAWQLAELEKAALSPGEDEALRQEQYRLENAVALAKSANTAQSALSDSGRDGSALERVWEAKEQLEKLAAADDELQPLLQQINDAYYTLEDAAQQIRSYAQAIVANPGRLEEVNQRLAVIKEACRKYGGSVEAALAQAEEYRLQLDQVENKDYYGRELAKELATTEKEFSIKSTALHQLRQQAAATLGEAITQQLQQLCMPQAVFHIALLPAPPSESGEDEAVFMICPNPGEGDKPVAKIASGGEMSRIMLAVKVILAQMDQVPTLIFDEIDSGLGGIALSSVAEKLAFVSQYTQTICVTHAPVMAAYAKHHLLVAKKEEKGRTYTTLQPLTPSGRIAELCRMLAGDKVTEATRKQAVELLALHQKTNIK